MDLPKTKVKAASKSPRKTVIYSKAKTGKTSLCAELENSLIIDLERGSDFIDAVKVNCNSVNEIKELCREVIKQGKPYKYGIVDTITKLEDMVLPFALQLYKATPMGKNFLGDNVLTLPNGAGYLYVRQAFFEVLSWIERSFERVILLGHLKSTMIEKDGKEVSAKDLDLGGKLKSMTSADVDCIGLMYRNKNNECILSFKTTDDVICGARPQHLKNQEIVISEITPEGEFKTFWNKVFVD
jgi:hypothetical protein